jgi:hypothetical protein
METVFKVGDKVYHLQYGWGEVTSIYAEQDYPIVVGFNSGKGRAFTKNGYLNSFDKTPTLSFTEYTLQGFTQERSILLPEVGELCLVKDYNDDTWLVREFAEYRHGLFICQAVHGRGEVEWKYMKRIKILD